MMKRVVLFSLLLLLISVNAKPDGHLQDEPDAEGAEPEGAEPEGAEPEGAEPEGAEPESEPDPDEVLCAFDESDERFTGVDPSSQGIVDKLIQRVQGTRFGSIIRRTIRRNLMNPNSVIRQMVGNMGQDPHDENFEEGDIDITEPVYGPAIELLNKVVGETRTVVGYLRAFGFFAKVLGKSPNEIENYKGGIPPCAITLAVKEFQVFNNLEPTGKLNKETRDLMKKDRCGNPDVGCETPDCIAQMEKDEAAETLHRRRRSLSRSKRWETITSRRWKHSDFKYFFASYTDDLPQDTQRAEIERALREWSDVAKVSFMEVDNEGQADVSIGFGSGDHGDKYAFSGPGGVLAHGYYPRKGDMHFDDDEKFTANQYSGTNLYYVATHEFGHVLGIRHTNVRGAIMAPYYPGFQAEIDLTDDDVAAARDLFGAGTGEVFPIGGGSAGGSDPEPGADREDEDEDDGPGIDNLEEDDTMDMGEDQCISEIHAAFNHPTEKYAYVISRGQYVRLEADDRNMPVVSEGYPQSVADQWPGVNGEVDAAFTDYGNARTYFFVKSSPRRKVYCWNWDNSEMEMQGEDEGNTGFAALPQSEIKGIASYRDWVLFLFENEYYLWTARTGLHQEAQSWPYQSGEKSVHVSGAFDAFLRGYFYTGSESAPEKYILFRSRELMEGDGGMVDKYSYRRFDEDMNLEMCL